MTLLMHKNDNIDAAEVTMPASGRCKVPCQFHGGTKNVRRQRKLKVGKFKRTRNDSDYLSYKNQCTLTRHFHRNLKTLLQKLGKDFGKEFQSRINGDILLGKIFTNIDTVYRKKMQNHVPTVKVGSQIFYERCG